MDNGWKLRSTTRVEGPVEADDGCPNEVPMLDSSTMAGSDKSGAFSSNWRH